MHTRKRRYARQHVRHDQGRRRTRMADHERPGKRTTRHVNPNRSITTLSGSVPARAQALLFSFNLFTSFAIHLAVPPLAKSDAPPFQQEKISYLIPTVLLHPFCFCSWLSLSRVLCQGYPHLFAYKPGGTYLDQCILFLPSGVSSPSSCMSSLVLSILSDWGARADAQMCYST